MQGVLGEIPIHVGECTEGPSADFFAAVLAANNRNLNAQPGFPLVVSPLDPADINSDGVVNVQDLTAFLGAFGKPCP